MMPRGQSVLLSRARCQYTFRGPARRILNHRPIKRGVGYIYRKIDVNTQWLRVERARLRSRLHLCTRHLRTRARWPCGIPPNEFNIPNICVRIARNLCGWFSWIGLLWDRSWWFGNIWDASPELMNRAIWLDQYSICMICMRSVCEMYTILIRFWAPHATARNRPTCVFRRENLPIIVLNYNLVFATMYVMAAC